MTTQHASELLAELLQNLMDVTGEPPEANCSCHLSPPCSDCVDYGSWREVFSACQSAIARATLVAPSTSQPLKTAEILQGCEELGLSSSMGMMEAFELGVKYAERHHQIKGGA